MKKTVPIALAAVILSLVGCDKEVTPVGPRQTLTNVKRSIGKGEEKQPFTFEYDFSYVDGKFHHSDYTENVLGMISKSAIYLDGDKVLNEDGDIVCKDLTFTPDGFISYLDSPDYGKYSITYSGRHISSIRMENFYNSDGLSVTRTDSFNWKNNVLESIVKETSIDGETGGVETVSFSYGDVPNPYRQFSGLMTLCLDNTGLLIPDLAFIGYFGDGPRMALSGYSET